MDERALRRKLARMSLTMTGAEAPAASNTSRQYLLVYDGDCAFCEWTLSVLQRILPTVPKAIDGRSHDLTVLGLDDDDVDYSSWLLVVDGGTVTHYAGVEGFAELLRRQPSTFWRFLGNALLLPGIKQLGHRSYDVIAENRHRLPHGTPACRVA